MSPADRYGRVRRAGLGAGQALKDGGKGPAAWGAAPGPGGITVCNSIALSHPRGLTTINSFILPLSLLPLSLSALLSLSSLALSLRSPL